MTIHTEVPAGVNFQRLSPGSVVNVVTKSRHYRIECMGRGAMRISGHPQYCPSPASALFQGSVDDEGSVAAGFIRPGMRLTYFLENLGPVATSRVVSVQVQN